jgi:L-cysteine:1D-myo-inositol 2-amino-2-deoxy-alpha-D-glucopyranoside ligase
MAVRLLVLAHRCRDAWAFGPDDVAAAEARLARWIEAVSGNGGPPFDDLLAEVRAAVADDLDTPRALAAVDAWADAALAVGTPAGPAEEDLVEGSPGVVARAIDALLGVRV